MSIHRYMQSILHKQKPGEIRKLYPILKKGQRKGERAVDKILHSLKVEGQKRAVLDSPVTDGWKHKALCLASSLRPITGDLPLLVAVVGLLFLCTILPDNAYYSYFLAVQRTQPSPQLGLDANAVYAFKHRHEDTPAVVSLVEQSYTTSYESLEQVQDVLYTGIGGSDDPSLRFLLPLDTSVYTVEAGDTLSEIASETGLRVDTLVSYNNIQNARRLQLGESLLIPDRDGILHVVSPGEGLDGIAEQYKVDKINILDANNLRTSSLYAEQVLFIPEAEMGDKELRLALGELFNMPTYGVLTSHFGYREDPFTGQRRFHYGIDIANASDTPITAANAGHVIYVGDNPVSYGKYVIVKHDSEFQTLYGHLGHILVAKGDYVGAGEILGYMGNTGRSTGPHLHFSIVRRGSFVNPKDYLF